MSRVTPLQVSNEWLTIEPQHGPRASRCTFTARGLEQLEALAAAGLNVNDIAAKLGIPGKGSAVNKVIARDPYAHAALNRGRALAKARKQPSWKLCEVHPETGAITLTAGGIDCIRGMMARCASPRSIAAALGITVKAYKSLLERDNTARMAADLGFRELEEKVSKKLLNSSHPVAAIFTAKARLDWDDKSAAKIEVDNSRNFQLIIPQPLSVEQYMSDMANRAEASRRIAESARMPALSETPRLPEVAKMLDAEPADEPPAWVREIQAQAEPVPEPQPTHVQNPATIPYVLHRATLR